MSTATFHVGDTRDVLATMADASVDLILTSPPFLALRSYLPDGHPDKDREIGSEPSPAAFLDTLLELTAEWGRVLAPHGSICVELGDTYSGSGGSGGDYNDGGLRDGQAKWSGSAAKRQKLAGNDNDRPARTGRNGNTLGHASKDKYASSDRRPDWPLAKSLCMIPQLYGIALAYGINPLTGTVSPAGRWRVRNVVVWCRPNPAVGALGDKVRPSTSYLTIACRAKDRWFDLDAVRTAPVSGDAGERTGPNGHKTGAHALSGKDWGMSDRVVSHPAGAPPLDHWVIPTHPFKGAHFATWPPALCEIPIKSMCPREVCIGCGEPRRRWTGKGYQDLTTLWSLCGCSAPTYRPGIVLDPFAGSGTTLAIATGHGRDAIGIDLDERNADLARQRVGMFLTVIDTKEAADETA